MNAVSTLPIRRGRTQVLLANVREYAFDQMNSREKGETERDTIFRYMTQLGFLTKDLAAVDSDEKVRGIERDRLRPLTHSLRRYGLRNHLTLARPVWGWPNQAINANTVSFTGGEAVGRLLAALCKKRGLRIADARGTGEAGSLRWSCIREAPVGVFDLTVQDRPTRGQVCHALGSALALGVYTVVLVSEGDDVPFNIDLPVTTLPRGDAAGRVLGDCLDEAFCQFIETAGTSSVPETAAQVLAFAVGDNATTKVLKKRLEEGRVTDPLEVRSVLEMLLKANGEEECALLLPVWPGAYPVPGERRCFHIMPFSEKWSESARRSVEAACQKAGVVYRRGDETGENRVIRSIWEEIGRASCVVVDLTGLNDNVCVELGLAQALGRPMLLLHRSVFRKQDLFPEISRLQLQRYDDANLSALVGSYLATERF